MMTAIKMAYGCWRIDWIYNVFFNIFRLQFFSFGLFCAPLSMRPGGIAPPPFRRYCMVTGSVCLSDSHFYLSRTVGQALMSSPVVRTCPNMGDIGGYGKTNVQLLLETVFFAKVRVLIPFSHFCHLLWFLSRPSSMKPSKQLQAQQKTQLLGKQRFGRGKYLSRLSLGGAHVSNHTAIWCIKQINHLQITSRLCAGEPPFSTE